MIVAQINAAQQQKFKATPHDLQVLEGSEAVLRCEVSNLAGQVQWTKDGFALGKCFFLLGFDTNSYNERDTTWAHVFRVQFIIIFLFIASQAM